VFEGVVDFRHRKSSVVGAMSCRAAKSSIVAVVTGLPSGEPENER